MQAYSWSTTAAVSRTECIPHMGFSINLLIMLQTLLLYTEVTMGKFDGILIASDLDQTLAIGTDVAKENIEAMEYFKREGGYFTIVTGRMPFFVDDIVERVNPNAPIGCVNGGGLYDTVKNEYMWQSKMPLPVNPVGRHIIFLVDFFKKI